MRYDSSPNALVATAACLAACLCACEANEYNTDAASDASTSLGGSTAAASNVRASGGRIASVTGSYRSSAGGNGARSTHADTVGGAGSMGGTIVTGGTSMMIGASTSTGASATTGALGGAQSTGGASTNGGAKSTRGTGASNSVPTMGGASMITHTPSAGTSTRVTLSGGASSTTQAAPAGGASVTGGTGSSSGAPNAGGSHSTSTLPPPDLTKGTEFSPYFYTWGWGNSAYAFSGLQDLRAKTELKSVTLAFVLSNGQCGATTDIQDHLEDVNAFRNAGGHVKASFGGANGTYLENACADEQSLATAIRNFVTATNVTDLDFDVEQASAMDATVNGRRARALKQLQTEKGIAVSLTLAATPRDKWGTLGGLSAGSLGVVRAMLDAQVKLTRVNVMAMDYGAYFSSGNSMGALAISALTDTLTQLKSLLPELSDAELWQLLGATPMIGQNDVATEVFSLDDARTLIAFAKEKNLGLVSFWAINRDQPCPYNSLAVCSQVNTRTFEFSEIFALVE